MRQAVNTAAERRHFVLKLRLLVDSAPETPLWAARAHVTGARDLSHTREHARRAVCVELSVTTACPVAFRRLSLEALKHANPILFSEPVWVLRSEKYRFQSSSVWAEPARSLAPCLRGSDAMRARRTGGSR